MQQLTQGTLLHGAAYRIEQVLGQGSFGITYLATHTALDKKVAIKEFFMKELNGRSEDGSITGMSDGSLSMDYARKFQKEALNLSRLEHPNIVRVTDSFEDNGTFYYVMDYIEGENLNDYVKHNHVSQQEAVDIIRDVAEALRYMHEEKHMLHLDMKPSNVMRRTSDGHIFLIDFGLSKHYSNDGQPETSTTIGLGTAGYAPIEQANQAKNGEFRPTIDVYALGATFYKLLTRETPPAASELVSDDKLLAENLRKHNVSAHLTEVVVKAMLPNVRKRTQTVKEFINMLSAPHTVNDSRSSESPTSSEDEETQVILQSAANINSESSNGSEKKYVESKSKGSGGKTLLLILVIAIGGTLLCLLARGCGNKTEPILAPSGDTVSVDTSACDTVACDSVAFEEYPDADYIEKTYTYPAGKRTNIGTDDDGDEWVLIEQNNDVLLCVNGEPYSISNINWGEEEHRLSSILAVKMYKGKIYFIAYDDSHSIGATGVMSGTQIFYYDINANQFNFIMNCHKAKFIGYTIDYCLAFITVEGEYAAANEYEYRWDTYYLQ